MTRLRKMMLEELQRRNFSEDTIRHYIHTVEDFARHFDRPPDRLGLRHIREYQAHLFQKRKLSSGSVTNHLAALRFFYIRTLKKAWSVAETPYPKKNHHLPAILSQEEVARLIDAAGTPFHRTLLMTLYATGLRRAEVTHLKVNDIDSKRMVIHVRAGKGRKDRDVMLSPRLLEELRQHSLLGYAHSSEKIGWFTQNLPSVAPNMCSSIWAATPIAWPSPTIVWSRLRRGRSPSAGGTPLITTNRSS